jgi:hypothetical protein
MLSGTAPSFNPVQFFGSYYIENMPKPWRLPKNNCVAKFFIKDETKSRVQTSGKLSAMAQDDSSSAMQAKSIDLELPSDLSVFEAIFYNNPRVSKNDLRQDNSGHWFIQ